MQSTALRCLSQALEVDMLTYPQIRRAGIHIPAASAWILHAAPRIFEFCKSKDLYDKTTEQRDWIGGSDGGKCLWSGDDGFSVERWMFWKQRFEVVRGLRRRGFAGRVVDDIVSWARQAVISMDTVEREDGYALGDISSLFSA
jgi:GNAT superfamily N-acetyltransferase